MKITHLIADAFALVEAGGFMVGTIRVNPSDLALIQGSDQFSQENGRLWTAAVIADQTVEAGTFVTGEMNPKTLKVEKESTHSLCLPN